MNNFKQKFKKVSRTAWEYSKEKFQRFWVILRRLWKKYHVTKVSILLVLSVALVLSVVLTIQARQVDVDSLQVGLQEPTVILDEEGEEAGTIYSQKGTYTPIEEISPAIQHAVVATEDQRFMEHPGFDLIGIGRAAVGYLANGYIVGGGSTITQQLTKNAYLTADQTLLRKLRELFLAIEIEKSYSKATILEMYLNNSYFGQGVWGVQDASEKYFDEDASDLTISEAATLAGLLKAPTNYNPIDNYDTAIDRRNTVLMLMEETGAITPEERQAAASSELQLVDGYDARDDNPYPYYFDAVIREAEIRYGYDREEISKGGYTIHTNLNQNQQQQMNNVYAQDWLFETAPDGTPSQSASVALNPQTGGVTAVVGGRGDYNMGDFNRAVMMARQPGSIIKPMGVYAPALEAGYEIDSTVIDEQQTFDGAGDESYTPSNVDHTYDGEIPMFQSLAESKNAGTVWLLDQIGVQRGYNKLEEFGIPMAEEDRNISAVALGGMHEGASPLEMASAYSVFANDGVQVDAHFITKIVDPTGAVVADNTDPNEKRVLSTEVNDDMNRMLLNVYSNGSAESVQPAGYEIAGKTGTTQTAGDEGATDQWMVGYTPDLVVTSWAGYDQTTEDHYMRSYTTAGIGQVLKAELESMLPYTTGTEFAVDDSDIEVLVRENQENETVQRIREGLERTGEVIRDTAEDAVNGARDWLDSFLNR
jgi:penicillin-binding protein 2A